MMAHPDSALSILDHIDPKAIHSPGNKARYALLITMARDKNYIYETNDSTILRAYKYFNKCGSRKNRMRSAYYLGVLRQNSGYTSSAVQAFLKAEHLAISIHDTHHLGLIYRHLSEIYTENYDYVRALEYETNALAAFKEKNEKLYADYMVANIAGLYIGQHNWKEALSWTSSLLRDSTIDNRLFCRALRYTAEAHLWQADYASADSCYKILLQRDTSFLTRDLFGLAMVKQFSGDSETADSLLKQIEATIETPLDSATYYDYKHNVYDLRGNIPAAYDALVNDYPAMGVKFPAKVMHTSEYVLSLKLKYKKAGDVYYLESDFLRNYNDLPFPHDLLKALGAVNKPFGTNDEESYSCGEGAVVLPKIDATLVEKLAAYIAERADNPKTDKIVTASPYTKLMLKKYTKLDVVTLEELAASLL